MNSYILSFFQTGQGRVIADAGFAAIDDSAAIAIAERQGSSIPSELRCGDRVVKTFFASAGQFIGYPMPADEERRIASLAEYDLFGSAAEVEYDQMTRLTAKLMQAPICLISIIGSDEQWLKARCGIDIASTPRNVAFCAHTIMSDREMVVLDAREDPRFRDNPLVTGAPGIRFYAGAPLVGDGGVRLGSLCVIDLVPHAEFDAHQRTLLHTLASIVSERFRLRREHRLLVLAEGDARAAAERDRVELASRADRLETIRGKVREIVDQIDTTARTLRVLALNAKIEAGRAGPQGLGFGAVAHEVDKLAGETRAATRLAHETLAL